MKTTSKTNGANTFSRFKEFIKLYAKKRGNIAVVCGGKTHSHTPEARKTAVYTESGWIAEVEIMADNSDEKQYDYTLRVVQTFADGYLGSLHDGHIFTVFAEKQYMAYCGWHLTAKEDTNYAE